ncbi:MAG TPA: cation:proton antiporter [Amycolatopsis sp.]|uniref:cation:proton antiporter n=1 Tax=Amycolatopsis sp. TaxID=37632 RepID=UPI002B47F3BF|nr:cation:proton antiporter [Amycolatopsis sp.]HKS44194.1 cation:proton antiporter [Amycolatopsis sp.]
MAIIGQFAGAFIGAKLSGLNRWEAPALGAGMNSRGVIEVIVAMTGLRLGVLDAAASTAIVLVAIVISLMAPPILRIAMRRAEKAQESRLGLVEERSGTRENQPRVARTAMRAILDNERVIHFSGGCVPAGHPQPGKEPGACKDSRGHRMVARSPQMATLTPVNNPNPE